MRLLVAHQDGFLRTMIAGRRLTCFQIDVDAGMSTFRMSNCNIRGYQKCQESPSGGCPALQCLIVHLLVLAHAACSFEKVAVVHDAGVNHL